MSKQWIHADTGIGSGRFPINGFGSIGPFLLASVYRSTDLGARWTQVNKMPRIPIRFVTMGNIVFGVGGSVWRSDDSGMNWHAASTGVTDFNLNTIAALNSSLFVGTQSGVFRSTDSGQSWQMTNLKAYINTLTTIGSTVLAGLENGGIYRSTDDGISWSHDVTGLTNGYINYLVTDGKNLFAGTYGSGVFVSTDSGDTWDTASTGLHDQWGQSALRISGLCVFDTLLVAGGLTADGQMTYTFVRPISEIVKQKSKVAEQPGLNADSIAIYPNPTTNSVTVRLGNFTTRRIEVQNVLGASLQAIAPRESDVTIDLSSLPSGTYFILIESPKGVVYRKIIRE